VNDSHGHPVGDLLLREVAAVLATSLRDIDLASRWGGDEFVLLLPATDLDGAVALAERIRTELAGHFVIAPDGTPIAATASFGVAVYPEAGSEVELLAAADSALYQAKRGGKNRVEPFRSTAGLA
jgi:diguanylate cyclase (GGDEF)-like protein